MAALPQVPYSVYYKNAISDGDSWTDNPLPDAICPRLVRGCAPTLPEADLLYRFGTIDGVYVPRLELLGKYVIVEIVDPAILFVGKVMQEHLERWPQQDDGMGVQRLSGGNQIFKVVGLEWFLTTATINHAMVYNSVSNVRIDRAFGFNTGFGDGRDVAYADRGNKDSRGLAFAEDADHTAIWTATEIVEYLLAEHAPRDKDGNLEPTTFVLATGASDYLDGFNPIIRTGGHSLWQVLNNVISPQRGLVWWTTYDVFANQVEINVGSMATDNITLPGGGTLPMNASQVTLDDIDDFPRRPTIVRRVDRRMDKIVVRGARRRSVFTVSSANSSLEPGWKSAEETIYKAAAADPDGKVNDRFRQQTKLERVYTTFQVPTTWGGDVDTGIHACPAFVQGSGSIVGKEKLHVASMRLLPTLPIRAGWNYTDATAPTANDPTNIRPEYQKPFAMVDIGSGVWRLTHEINVNAEDDGEERLTSYHLHPLQGSPGFQLKPTGGMPHALAKNHITPDGMTDASTEHDPEVDYDTLKATVCAEWDAYCEGYWPEANPTTDPLLTQYVYLDEDRARFDWLAEGTNYDVTGDSLATTTTGGALRDDRNLCADIARLAYEWYGNERADFSLDLDTTELPVDLGDLITTVGTDEAQETVNAIVSQITHRPEGGGTSISAGFAELDFANL